MAKDKSKSKGKKKLKAIEKNAKATLDDAKPRIQELVSSEVDKAESELGKAKPKLEKVKSEIEEIPSVLGELRSAAEASLGEVPSEEALYELAELFKVFADTTRLKILYALVDGGKCVADISEAAGVSQSATSHQLKGMKQTGVVKFARDGKQVIYSLANLNVQAMLAQGISSMEK